MAYILSEAQRRDLEKIRTGLRRAIGESGLTQEQIGIRMGFEANTARASISRLLSPQRQKDMRLSTLLSLAKALERPLHELLVFDDDESGNADYQI